MAQSRRRSYVVGDYVMGNPIGTGSFSTVWHARHSVHGTEVAIKEIVTARLNPKLQESLKSEIIILKRINHPNIIRLHDMIEESGKMYIILEYCKGGDLSMYIQKCQGRIPEATAKHFMQQLAEGLKILRENNLIHRDLKPQNLLLSSKEDNCLLKIADFGFARSLQPRGLAETLCGSPLYMAPEIMQLQKYDAKADLWSVGTILFQLVTGKPPFTGSNQIQLLQNIIKSSDLQFPAEAKDLSPHCIDLCRKLLRCNPVERLTYEEFFNHPYLHQKQPDESFWNKQSERISHDLCLSENNTRESMQEYCLPFSLDDVLSVPNGSPSSSRMSTMRSTYGFSLNSKPDWHDNSKLSSRPDSFKHSISSRKPKTAGSGSNLHSHQFSEGKLKEAIKTTDLESLDNRQKVPYSLEPIDQDYVMVAGPPMSVLSVASPSEKNHCMARAGGMALEPGFKKPTSSAPVPIIGGATGRAGNIGSLESRMSAPGTSQGSMDVAGTFEQSSTDYMAQIKSLQDSASTITEIVNDKMEGGNQLEAFSLQLVVLAIWKHSLHTCHTYARSATGASPSHGITKLREVFKVPYSPNVENWLDNIPGIRDMHSQIERAFLHEVGNAEELAKVVESGNLPDAMELIFQSALALGRLGAVDEYMGNIENAVVFYAKAVRLFHFLLVEAPCLILNPPFTLTNSDKYRIQNYIDALNNRQSISRSQRMCLLKASGQSPS